MSDSDSLSHNIEKTFDEFTKVTVIQHKRWVGFGGGISGFDGDRSIRFRLQKITARERADLVFQFETTSGTWFHTKSVAFLLDEHVEQLEFEKVNSQVVPSYGLPGNIGCRETGVFIISIEFLKTICDSKSIKIRIYSGSEFLPAPDEWCLSFRTYCQQYYNGVFDKSQYPASVHADIPAGQGCFIATATMGSYSEPRVVILRQLRDQCLLTSQPGRWLVSTYYAVSPPIAAVLSHSSVLRCVFRYLLVIPLAKIAEQLLNARKRSGTNEQRLPFER